MGELNEFIRLTALIFQGLIKMSLNKAILTIIYAKKGGLTLKRKSLFSYAIQADIVGIG